MDTTEYMRKTEDQFLQMTKLATEATVKAMEFKDRINQLELENAKLRGLLAEARSKLLHPEAA